MERKNLKNDRLQFAAEMTIGDNPKDLRFIPSCSGAFDFQQNIENRRPLLQNQNESAVFYISDS